jgi:outer membrane protein assembly factor BamB
MEQKEEEEEEEGGNYRYSFSHRWVCNSQGNIFMSVETSLYCLFANGTLNWKYQPPPFAPQALLNGPCIDSTYTGLVFVTGNKNGLVMAFTTNSTAASGGKPNHLPVWAFDGLFLGVEPKTTPAIGPGGKTLYFGASQTFVALNAVDGSLLWSVRHIHSQTASNFESRQSAGVVLIANAMRAVCCVLLCVAATIGVSRFA